MIRVVTAHGKRIEVETLHAGAPEPRKHARHGKRFTRVPAAWEEVLAKARVSGSTYAVAIALLFEAWRLTSRGHKPIVKLTNVMLKRVGVGRKGKRAALLKLQELRLVGVGWHANKSPTVAVYFLE